MRVLGSSSGFRVLGSRVEGLDGLVFKGSIRFRF